MNKSLTHTDPESYASIFFGGSFDPPHTGHVQVAAAAKRLMPHAQLFVVPALAAPRLAGKAAPGSSFAHRFAMCKLAFLDAIVDPVEETLPQPSYTVQTLQNKRLPRPAALLLGADQFEQFDRWREPQTILSMTSLLVASRTTRAVEAQALAKKLNCRIHQESPQIFALQGNGWQSAVILLQNDLYEISSTAIREDHHSLAKWVPPAVAAYISKHNIYGELPNVAN
jgi:nicotinate-nucleotide adenylyltransferase